MKSEGNATSAAAKELAGKHARVVRGVEKVNNNMSALYIECTTSSYWQLAVDCFPVASTLWISAKAFEKSGWNEHAMRSGLVVRRTA